MSKWQFLIYAAVLFGFSFLVPFFVGFLCIVLAAVSLGVFLGLVIAEHSSLVKGKKIPVR